MTKTEKQNIKSPFKEKESFIKEIKGFLGRFNSIIHDHSLIKLVPILR